MKYRDHRGGLSKSLSTTQEVKAEDDIIAHLNTIYAPFKKAIAEIKFEYCGYDDRTGWDTYYVLQRLEGESHFTVTGMSDGIFKE